VRFFIDNNLPPALAGSLHSLSVSQGGPPVVHLRDKFQPNVEDHIWISTLAGERDWVIVTRDRLTKNPLEKQALRESGLTSFFLVKGWANQKFWEVSSRIVRWWPRITEQAAAVQAGATFLVPWQFSGNGKFKQFNF